MCSSLSYYLSLKLVRISFCGFFKNGGACCGFLTRSRSHEEQCQGPFQLCICLARASKSVYRFDPANPPVLQVKLAREAESEVLTYVFGFSKGENAIHSLNVCSEDSAVRFVNSYLLDSDIFVR